MMYKTVMEVKEMNEKLKRSNFALRQERDAVLKKMAKFEAMEACVETLRLIANCPPDTQMDEWYSETAQEALKLLDEL